MTLTFRKYLVLPILLLLIASATSCNSNDVLDDDIEYVTIDLLGKWVDSLNIDATTYEMRELVFNKNSSFVALTSTFERSKAGNKLQKTEQLAGGFTEFVVGINFFVKQRQIEEFKDGDKFSTNMQVEEIMFPNCKYEIENNVLELKYDHQSKTETRKYKRFALK